MKKLFLIFFIVICFAGSAIAEKPPDWIPPGHRGGHGGGNSSATAIAGSFSQAISSSYSNSVSSAFAFQAQTQSVTQGNQQSVTFADGAFKTPDDITVRDKALGKWHDPQPIPDFQRFSGRVGPDVGSVNPPWLKRITWTPVVVSKWRTGGNVLLYPNTIKEGRDPEKPSPEFDVVSAVKPDAFWLGDGYLEVETNLHDVWALAVPALCQAGATKVKIVDVVLRDKTTGDTKSVGVGGGGAVVNNGKGQYGFSGGTGFGWSWGYAENVEVIKVAFSYFRENGFDSGK